MSARAFALLVVAGCAAAPPEATVARASSTTLTPAADGALWMTSPDDGRVVAVDPTTLAVRQSLPVSHEPATLAWAGDALVVTQRQGGVVVLRGGASRAVTVPCGGTLGVIALDASRALVSCPHDDLVVEVDVARAEAVRALRVPGRPGVLARVGDAVHVGARGALHTFSLAGLRALPEGGPWGAPRALAEAQGSTVSLAPGQGRDATRVEALAADGARGLLAVWSEVDRDSDRARPAAQGGYGAVRDGDPRIAPALWSPCGDRYAVFDGGPGVASGPSALGAGRDALWVVHRGTGNVLALRCDAAGPRRRGVVTRLGTWRVGRGARGVVVSPDGRTAWVDVGDEAAVARLSLDDAAPARVREPRAVLRRPRGPDALDPALIRGRGVFHDAADTHLTPSGVVSCATCHPDGGDDGLVWFLHTETVARKLRRTPPAWTARAPLAPYHWDGEFRDVTTLSRATIRGLMGGDALLVDVDAVAAWLASVPPPPPRPVAPGAQASVDRGRATFDAAGCAVCHAGPWFSDGQRHDVLAPAADPDARLDAVDTPTLRGVRARAPYLHDGRAATLRDVLTAHNPDDRHGRTRGLDAATLDDLVRYLEAL